MGYFIQSLFRRVRYITLVNLLTADDIATGRPAGMYDPADPRDAHVLLPEYLTCEDKSEQLAGHAIEWLTDPMQRAPSAWRRSCELRDRFAQGGASARAAEYIAARARKPRSAAA